ncbi:MAG: response regulator [Vicinamibacterales bacterium]
MTTVPRPVVLVVEDEPITRRGLGALLSADAGQVGFAASGAEALERVGEIRPDVILLDAMMPGMDGYQVCAELQARADTRHVPVIMVTALSDRQSLTRALEAGATDFLSKPVSGAELRARVRAMWRIKRQHDELTEALRFRRDLSRMVVHDMRSPLMVMRASLELAALDPAAHPADQLQRALRQVERLGRLVDELLLAAKMEAGRLHLARRPVDLAALVADVVEDYRELAAAQQIRLAVDPAPCPPAPLDARLIARVVDNLVGNALKFSPRGGVVTIRVASGRGEDGAFLGLEIGDEGPGIPEAFRERIFESFGAVELRHAGVSQTGLGLAFCRLAVDAHGGAIACTANTPTGTVFSVRLPWLVGVADDDAEADAAGWPA